MASVVAFFIVLPDPVTIPRDLCLGFWYDERHEPYLSIVGRAPESPWSLVTEEPGRVDVAIRMWTAPSHDLKEWLDNNAAVATVEFVQGVASRVELADLASAAADTAGRPTGLRTVAEVVTRDNTEVHPPDAEYRLEDLENPLLRSIDCLLHLTRAFRLGLSAPIRLPSYQRLPHRVLKGHFDDEGHLKEYSVEDLNNEYRSQGTIQSFDLDSLTQALGSLQLLAAGDPAALTQERLIEAERYLVYEGDHGAAVVEAAIAAEVHFDALLGLLLWEKSGSAPGHTGSVEHAAGCLSRPLKSRVKSQYHPLIGGSWDPGTPGPIRDWDLNVARLRAHVVHRGHRPSADETAECLNTVNSLISFTRERVAARCRDYPRTAMMLVGKPELERLGKWPLIKRFAEDMAPHEPPWRTEYWKWRDRVEDAVTRRT